MKNPVNFLLLLTLLFWVPQLLNFRNELKDNNDLHRLFMTLDPEAGAPKPASKTIVTGPTSAAAGGTETCLLNWVRLYQGTDATPTNMIFDKTRFAGQFTVASHQQTVTIHSDRVRMLNQPTADQVQWKTTQLEKLPDNFFSKKDQVPEALESRIRATQPLTLQEACIPFGENVVASGFVSDKMEMNYTVSVPFTLFLGDVLGARAQIGVHVSRAYVMTALLSMLVSFVGLLFILNIMLRNRINLELQPIAEGAEKKNLAAFRQPSGPIQNETSDFIQNVHPQAKDVSFAQFGTLPSFYRYHWDDGLDLQGRKAALAVTSSGIVIVETDSKKAPKGVREVAWNDLFCVFFAQWGKQDTWVDIITREGERYQVLLRDASTLRGLLKRWDASEINLRKLAS